jgi:hypothetical protein
LNSEGDSTKYKGYRDFEIDRRRIRMAKDLPGFIAEEGARREGSVIREKNFVDANKYETVAYLKHLDMRNEPKMVLFENVPALNGGEI